MKNALGIVGACLALISVSDRAESALYEFNFAMREDHLLELGNSDGDVCSFTSACFPAGFDPTNKIADLYAGAVPDMVLGAAVSGRLEIDDLTYSVLDCSIGFADCGDVMAVKTGKGGGAVIELFDVFATREIIFDFDVGEISFEGEAGDYMMMPCDDASPDYAGLPAGFCTYFGYGGTFDILPSLSLASIAPVPVPASGLLILGAMAAMAGLRKRA